MPDVSNPPGLAESGDVDHDQTQGGTSGNPHANSAADGDTQPPESHGNEAHTEDFSTSGYTDTQAREQALALDFLGVN